MAKVFEDFVLDFYKLERRDLGVKKERLYWLATSRTDPELKRLPSMETDISVRDGTRTLIIDAKYCRRTFQSYYDSQSIHSANLYQVFAYSKNLEHQGGPDSEAEGMLLYPVVKQSVRETYEMHGHTIKIYTVDFSQPWQDIRAELLELVA